MTTGPLTSGPCEVPRTATPLTEVDLAYVLQLGHLDAFGRLPTPNRLAMAWAQCALEHARGQAIWCNNIGNVSADYHWVESFKSFYALVVRERVHRDPDEWKTVTMRFRAHTTPRDGAVDYWRLLERKFASALEAFDQGDAALAAHRLSVAGYYTAVESIYAKGLSGLLAFYQRSALSRMLPPPLSAEEVAALDQVAAHVLRVESEAREGQDGAAALERLLGPQPEPVSA